MRGGPPPAGWISVTFFSPHGEWEGRGEEGKGRRGRGREGRGREGEEEGGEGREREGEGNVSGEVSTSMK